MLIYTLNSKFGLFERVLLFHSFLFKWEVPVQQQQMKTTELLREKERIGELRRRESMKCSRIKHFGKTEHIEQAAPTTTWVAHL